jgi:hypothetical protein
MLVDNSGARKNSRNRMKWSEFIRMHCSQVLMLVPTEVDPLAIDYLALVADEDACSAPRPWSRGP